MFEDKLKAILEHELVAIPGVTNKKTPVLVNPSPAAIKKLQDKTGTIGGILHGKDLYLWDRDVLDHESVEEHFVLPNTGFKSEKNPIPFYLMKDKGWFAKLSPASWMGVDPYKDLGRVLSASPAFKGVYADNSYFDGYFD